PARQWPPAGQSRPLVLRSAAAPATDLRTLSDTQGPGRTRAQPPICSAGAVSSLIDGTRRSRCSASLSAGSCRIAGAAEGAVDDHIRMTSPVGIPRRLCSFGDPAVTYLRRWRYRPEPGRQLGERFALAQVGQHQQRQLSAAELAPPRADVLAVTANDA